MAWQAPPCFTVLRRTRSSSSSTRNHLLFMSSEEEWNDREAKDSNLWQSSSDDSFTTNNSNNSMDWQDMLTQKEQGTFWSSFEPADDQDNESNETAKTDNDDKGGAAVPSEEQAAEAWLETLASLSAEEVSFNLKEADRADTARQMEEWGFDKQVIANALDVAVDTALEEVDQVTGMQEYREASYLNDIDLATVESHTTVEKDEETGEPVRTQMVYVDEHTCIGCTNCAMIAQSTFYMNPEHGRARVFSQWGDDAETIQVAIETCPVDCIHYVPYDELVKLEVERRDQNINFKGRLVSQGENGNTLSHRVGGANGFTAPQVISGNMGTRCSNCPSRGCQNCPMYGVGKNPEYERKEKLRKERQAKLLLKQEREKKQKSADL